MPLVLEKTTVLNNNSINAKPFLKWAGGKARLTYDLEKRLPPIIKSTRQVNKYFEIFIGGGAFFFYMKGNYNIEKAYLFDINKELFIGYKVIQNNPDDLIKKLNELQQKFYKLNAKAREEFFYCMRDVYNNQIENFDYQNYNRFWIERASLLIFLNKTCFNGLYRQNKRGEFNVPFGGYENPKICDEKNIYAVYELLQNTELFCDDFEEAASKINKDSFVYLDPPYRPLNKTSSFTDYSKEGFTDIDQIRLAEFYKKMNTKGAYLMLSNSDSQDNFLQELYCGFNITKAMANRMINCNGNGRGKITELIITNY